MHGVQPTRVHFFSLLHLHARCELALAMPEIGNRVERGEFAHLQSRQPCHTQGCGFRHGRPVNPYPDTPISLSIEGSVDQAAAANTPLRVTNETAPNGRYLVLRIAADQGGHTAALVMPLGGRPALDAAWIRSGDRTADGFTIEAVESKLVRVRTPANRVIYWTPQQ